MDFTTAAVLPAAGCGQRMGSDRPKQFLELGGRPLLFHAADTFRRIPWFGAVVLVVPAPIADCDRKFWSDNCGSKIVLTAGNTTRHRSIWNGLKTLLDSPPDIVVIHDGVRPFIDERTLQQCATLAWQHGACGMTRPLVSTVLVPDSEGFLYRSLDRSKHKASEMPQAFRYEAIVKAYESCSDHDLDFGTDCLHLVLKYCGIRAKLIDGPDTLWKVTYKRDLYAAERILKEQNETRPNIIVTCLESLAVSETVQDCLLSISSRENISITTEKKLSECVDTAVPRQTIIPVAMVTNSHGIIQVMTELKELQHCQPLTSRVVLVLLVSSSDVDLFQTQQQIRDVSTSNALPIHAIVTQVQGERQPDFKSKETFIRVLRDVLSLDSNSLPGQLFIA